MGFPRQEYWSGLPFPSPGPLPDPGIKPASPALLGRFFTAEPPGKPLFCLDQNPSSCTSSRMRDTGLLGAGYGQASPYSSRSDDFLSFPPVGWPQVPHQAVQDSGLESAIPAWNPSVEPRTDQGGDSPTLAWGRLCCRVQWQLPTSKQPGHIVDLFHYRQVFFCVFCCYSSVNISFIPSDAVGILDPRSRT